MSTISKINGTGISAISKLSGILKGSTLYASTSGPGTGASPPPATPLPSRTDALIGWWDPSQGTVDDTTVTSLAYTNGYTTLDHAQTSATTNLVDLSGLNCWYLDGVNDRVSTLDLTTAGTAFPLNTNNVTFTIEGWVRSNGGWINNGNWWNMGFNGAYRNRFTSGGNLWNYPTVSRQTSGTFATNTWWHITVTMTALVGNSNRFGDLTVYKNGELMQQWTSIDKDPNQGGTTNFWGGYTSVGESGRFYLGMHRRYTTALTAAEVEANFDLEKAQYGY